MIAAFAHALLLVVLLPIAATSIYLGLLALLALLPARAPRAGARTRRFAIVVPAHNEEAALPALLASIAVLDYPAHLVRTLVIADNCDDATADVAHRCGADAIERMDPERRGKGYALAYGLTHLSGAWDAVVFADADCVVSANLLAAFDAHITAGARAVQAYYTMAPPAASPTRLARALALELVHRVRPQARRWFGGSAGLKGSGMCFTRDAIAKVGWTATGLAEDAEQHVALLMNGMRVAFVPEATVVGAMPSALSDASTQHRRWEAGRLRAARAAAIPLLRSGVRQRAIAPVDAAIDLLIPPVSLLGAALPVLLGAACVSGATVPIALAVAAVVSFTMYVAAGVVMLRPGAAELARGVGAIPAYVLWKLIVYVRAMTTRGQAWERTPRGDAYERASRTTQPPRA